MQLPASCPEPASSTGRSSALWSLLVLQAAWCWGQLHHSLLRCSPNVTKSKLGLLTARQDNKSGRGVEARNSDFIWKAGRLRRWRTNVLEYYLF